MIQERAHAWKRWLLPSLGASDPRGARAGWGDMGGADLRPQGWSLPGTPGPGPSTVRSLPRPSLDLGLPQLMGRPGHRARGDGRASKRLRRVDPPAVLATGEGRSTQDAESRS